MLSHATWSECILNYCNVLIWKIFQPQNLGGWDLCWALMFPCVEWAITLPKISYHTLSSWPLKTTLLYCHCLTIYCFTLLNLPYSEQFASLLPYLALPYRPPFVYRWLKYDLIEFFTCGTATSRFLVWSCRSGDIWFNSFWINLHLTPYIFYWVWVVSEVCNSFLVILNFKKS